MTTDAELDELIGPSRRKVPYRFSVYMGGHYRPVFKELKSFAMGFAYGVLEAYPCPPLRVVDEETGETIFSHSGHGKAHVNGKLTTTKEGE